MKKLVLFFIIFGTILGLSACSLTKDNTDAATDSIDVYVFSALSSVELLSSDGTASLEDSLIPLTSTTEEETEVENELDDVNQYVHFIEMFLSGDGNFDITVTDSDDPAFEQMATITCGDLNEDSTQFILYFTETALDGKTVITDENIDTIEIAVDGKLLVDDQVLFIEATRTIDAESGEFVYTVKTSLDGENYVEVTCYQEGSMNRYQYKVMQQNQLKQQSEIQVQTGSDGTQISLSFQNGEKTGEYQFSREKDSEGNYIRINYQLGNEDGEIQVRTQQQAGNMYQYRYNIETQNGASKQVDMPRGRQTNTDNSNA